MSASAQIGVLLTNQLASDKPALLLDTLPFVLHLLQDEQIIVRTSQENTEEAASYLHRSLLL